MKTHEGPQTGFPVVETITLRQGESFALHLEKPETMNPLYLSKFLPIPEGPEGGFIHEGMTAHSELWQLVAIQEGDEDPIETGGQGYIPIDIDPNIREYLGGLLKSAPWMNETNIDAGLPWVWVEILPRENWQFFTFEFEGTEKVGLHQQDRDFAILETRKHVDGTPLPLEGEPWSGYAVIELEEGVRIDKVVDPFHHGRLVGLFNGDLANCPYPGDRDRYLQWMDGFRGGISSLLSNFPELTWMQDGKWVVIEGSGIGAKVEDCRIGYPNAMLVDTRGHDMGLISKDKIHPGNSPGEIGARDAGNHDAVNPFPEGTEDYKEYLRGANPTPEVSQ